MSYTTIEQVQEHLVVEFPLADEILAQPLVMRGVDYLTFFGGSVNGESLKVKSVQQHQLNRVSLTLASGANVLWAAGVEAASVVVASDSSLGTIHDENVDYIIDYAAGELRLKSGGALSVGQILSVWYRPCSLYLIGVDYRVQAGQGSLARMTSGSIADGETVLVDYQPEFSAFTDSILAAAVRDANGKVERDIDPDSIFGADPVLAGAATYLALEIICRTAAARELGSQRGLDRIAHGWMKLAEEYHRVAQSWLSSFRPPVTPPASPTIS